ncbi:MAG: class I SAM-dependent methyltransferase [Bacteroidetes bacterium]|nr:class I SAM-dependent methyltransferase [Bacteroidota bacterium]MDA1267652.1 class I SAM-dependent methyltransferase [Bacteroidota bacterium]
MRQLYCPVCQTPPIFPPASGSRTTCSSCKVAWTFLSEAIDAAALYRDEVYAIVDNRNSLFEKIIFSESSSILKQAKKLKPNATLLLDFGSGKGQFLAVAKTQGWEGIGIETEATRGEFARNKYEVEVHIGYYRQGPLTKAPVDLITLNHVLEHLPEPVFLLRELLNHNLSTGGLLYVEVPRSDSWQAQLAGETWMHWDIPKHLSHWTEPVLSAQLEALGLKKVGTRNFSIHLGVLGMLQALLSKVGYHKNLVLQLKKKKSLGLLLLIATFLPLAWALEVLSIGKSKSGICGVYFQKHG